MVDALVVLVLLGCAVAAALGGVDAVRDRPVGEGQLRALLAVAVLLLVQAVVALVRLAAGDRPEDVAVFVSYLVTVVLVPPVAAVWGRGDGSRWGSVVVAVGAVSTAVMVVRLWDLWRAAGG